MHELLSDFEKQTHHVIPASWPDIVIVSKKEYVLNSGLRTLGGPQRENKSKRNSEKYLNLARELKKKLWNMKAALIPVVTGALGTIPKSLVKKAGKVGNRRTTRDRPNYSIVEIYQNTEKSPGNPWKLAVTQTLVKNYQLTLV